MSTTPAAFKPEPLLPGVPIVADPDVEPRAAAGDNLTNYQRSGFFVTETGRDCVVEQVQNALRRRERVRVHAGIDAMSMRAPDDDLDGQEWSAYYAS